MFFFLIYSGKAASYLKNVVHHSYIIFIAQQHSSDWLSNNSKLQNQLQILCI